MLDLLHRRPDRPLIIGRAAAVAALAFAAAPLLASTAQAASPVPLGTADSFALLAGSTITNVGPSTISGDIGLCCTGLATPGLELATQPRGARYIGTGGVAASAQDDLDIGYANAASQAVTATLPVDLSLAGTPATPLLPGVYESTSHGALAINTGLTLDFQGNPNAVFIFQGSSLTTAAAEAGSIRIVNGGSAPSACNIFWQLSDATQGVTLGAASAFKGTTMSLGASVLGTGATVEGRILTRRSKAVTLLANTITQSPCATTSGNTVTPTPTPIATSSIPGGTSVPLVTTAALPSVKPTVAAKPVAVPIAGPLLSGPSAPVRGPFVVSVTGHAIESVVFYVDGRRVSKVHARPGRTVFKLRIDPRHQNRKIHRVTARIRTRTTKTTLRIVYRRPPVSPRPPQFTG